MKLFVGLLYLCLATALFVGNLVDHQHFWVIVNGNGVLVYPEFIWGITTAKLLSLFSAFLGIMYVLQYVEYVKGIELGLCEKNV